VPQHRLLEGERPPFLGAAWGGGGTARCTGHSAYLGRSILPQLDLRQGYLTQPCRPAMPRHPRGVSSCSLYRRVRIGHGAHSLLMASHQSPIRLAGGPPPGAARRQWPLGAVSGCAAACTPSRQPKLRSWRQRQSAPALAVRRSGVFTFDAILIWPPLAPLVGGALLRRPDRVRSALHGRARARKLASPAGLAWAATLSLDPCRGNLEGKSVCCGPESQTSQPASNAVRFWLKPHPGAWHLAGAARRSILSPIFHPRRWRCSRSAQRPAAASRVQQSRMPARHGCLRPPFTGSPAAIPATLARCGWWWSGVPCGLGRLKKRAGHEDRLPHHRGM